MRKLFEEKYKECEKSLFLVAMGYLHNTEDARDCVQEAVFSAFLKFDKLKNKDFFKTWLTRIVINKCKDFLKKQRYTKTLADTQGIFYGVPEEETQIMEALCDLPGDLCIYITLRFYNDMKYEDVAKTLKLPVSTVKYRTKKALEELKIILEGEAEK